MHRHFHLAFHGFAGVTAIALRARAPRANQPPPHRLHPVSLGSGSAGQVGEATRKTFLIQSFNTKKTVQFDIYIYRIYDVTA